MKILINETSAQLGGGITVLRNLLPALASEDGGRNQYDLLIAWRLFEELV
jgi:hypothetical protein